VYKLLMEHAKMAKSLKHLSDTVDPHFEFLVLERIKRETRCEATRTEETALCLGIWVEHLVVVLWEMGIGGGCLFSRRLLPAKLLEFKDDFFMVLEKVEV
jgi:hypothetical protein